VTSIRGLLVLLDGGLALGVTRDVVLSRDNSVAKERLTSAYWLYAGIAAAVLVFGLAIAGLPAVLLHLSGSSVGLSRAVTTIVVVEAAIALASSPLSATLRGHSQFDILATASIIQSAIGLIAASLLISRWGLIGVAVATLAARVFAVGFVLGYLSLYGFRPWRSPASAAGLRAVIGFALPLYILIIANQLAIGSDVPIVAVFYGSAAAASYGVGAVIPAAAAGLLFTILDVGFPSLSGATRDNSTRLMRSMLIVGSALGALGFATIALNSAALLTVWVGTVPTLAVTVMSIYSLTWMLNVPSHVLTIGAIAKGQHKVVAPVVLCEALVNVSLSVFLAATYSANGPALATLLTLFVSNMIILPIILRRRLHLSLRTEGSRVFLGLVCGLALSLIVWLITSHLSEPLNQLIGASIGTLLAASVMLIAGPRLLNRSIGY
jgi:O-antigen/teichoic acid export membrane protein